MGGSEGSTGRNGIEYSSFCLLLVCIHLKLRIVVFLLPLNEYFISTEGADAVPVSLPHCAAMFLE